LSIITINYNNLVGLKRTIESVISQLNETIEFIVIDGGSTDGSKMLIESNQQSISKWVSEKDEGIYYAQNKGISMATGEYCLFLNSGDYLYERDTLNKVLPTLQWYDIVYGNMKIENHNELSDGFMPSKINLRQMMSDTLWHPVAFIKRQLFFDYGFYNTEYKICADYDFFFKVIIVNKVNCFHIHHFISVFDLKGFSSDIKNKSQILHEREAVQATYLSRKQINNYKRKQFLINKLNRIKSWFL